MASFMTKAVLAAALAAPLFGLAGGAQALPLGTALPQTAALADSGRADLVETVGHRGWHHGWHGGRGHWRGRHYGHRFHRPYSYGYRGHYGYGRPDWGPRGGYYYRTGFYGPGIGYNRPGFCRTVVRTRFDPYYGYVRVPVRICR